MNFFINLINSIIEYCLTKNLQYSLVHLMEI